MGGHNRELEEAYQSDLVQESETDLFADSIFPVWIFDVDGSCVHWANPAALALWNAISLDELRSRDMGADMSATVRARLDHYRSEFARGHLFDEVWTIYPNGVPKTILCRFRGCRLKTGGIAMLCEAQLAPEEESQVLRGSQALLYTGAMVTMYDQEGHCIYANPAALRAFSTDREYLSDRICDKGILKLLCAGLKSGQEGHYVSQVVTESGTRIHEIEARNSFDVATGKKSLLLTEIDISEKEQAKKEVEYLANHDFLTGLYNRHFLGANAETFIVQALEQNHSVFVCLLDLDRFKLVNDSLGHKVGDQLLKEVSNKLNEAFPTDSIIARFGGDEFCMLLRSARPITDITRMCRKLATALKQPLGIGRQAIGIDASIGVSYNLSKEDFIDFDELVSKADLALYSAKRSDVDTVQIFRNRLFIQRQRFLKVEEELSNALMNAGQGLSLSFQPVVCLLTRKIVGLEALARLRGSDGRDIPPSEFIPIAESTGMINELGGWVLEHAVESQLKMTKALQECKLSVNVSPTQFRSISLLRQLRNLKQRPGFDTAKLEIELTETALRSGESHFIKMLQEIVEMGYPLAIDDFGSAYSNIARLNGYPVKTIKIDRSMITHSDGKLAAGAIDIVKALNLSVVAEGIETQEQSDWLVSKGCTDHQGFLYSKALSFAELMQISDRDITSLEKFK